MGLLVNSTVSARKPVVFAFAMLLLLTAWACMICLAPVIATYIPLSIVITLAAYALVRDLNDGLRFLVGSRDDLRIGVECALRRDHIHQLRGQIHVGAFQRAGLNAAESRRSCRTL